MEGLDKHELTKFISLLWGCIHECSYCKDRQKKEFERKRTLRQEEERKRDLIFIDEHIEELQKVRARILSNKYVDINDYYFSYEVEDEIREEAFEDYNERFEPRGRR